MLKPGVRLKVKDNLKNNPFGYNATMENKIGGYVTIKKFIGVEDGVNCYDIEEDRNGWAETDFVIIDKYDKLVERMINEV